jgi:hypothetical protein
VIDARPYARRLIVLAIPLALVVFWAALLNAKGPYWLAYNSDPDYAYLLNAVNVANGTPPGHVDHPGTSIQLIGAAVVSTVHAVAGERELAADVVARPERYLTAIQWVLFAMYAASLVLLGWMALVATGSAAVAFIVQLTPVLSPTIPAHVACVKPEPLLLALSACAGAIVLATLVPRQRARVPLGLAAVLGVVSGAAVATKITAAPLLLLGVVLLDSCASVGVFAGGTVVAAAVFTMPAWSVLGKLVSFAEQIATHSGTYGLGPPALLDTRAYAAALEQLLSTEPTLVAAIVATAVALVVARRLAASVPPRIARALAAVLIVEVGSILFVARHPSNHYLAPALGLTGVAFALAYTVLADLLKHTRLAARALVGTVLGAAIAGELLSMEAVRRDLARARDAHLEAVAEVKRRYPQANVLPFYRSSNPAYALHFGDSFAGLHFEREIDAVHPGSAFYNIWTREFEVPTSWRPRVGSRGLATFVLQGVPLSPAELALIPTTLVWSNDREALYELR